LAALIDDPQGEVLRNWLPPEEFTSLNLEATLEGRLVASMPPHLARAVICEIAASLKNRLGLRTFFES
jgi:hypothetical protein